MMIECPHCHMETEHKVIDHINIDRNPELRAKVQDLSVFRVKCPNCGETVLAVHPCLYHDMANQFMVWLWTEDGQVPKAEFDPLAGYTLRVTDSLNTFREKINILERGLDDRTIEIMKLLLFAQLNRDLDVVSSMSWTSARAISALWPCFPTAQSSMPPCRARRISACTRMWKPICTRRAASSRALI